MSLSIFMARHGFVRRRLCVCVCFHPQELGLTGCCHGYWVLTPQELCRLVEDIINNKGLEAKVTRGSGWGTSSHSYYNWQPFFVSLSLCVWVCVCVCARSHAPTLQEKFQENNGGNRTLTHWCCIYLLDKQFVLNMFSWLVAKNL